MPAPVLDGTASGIASGATTVSAALTTTSTNDIICALVQIEQAAASLWITGVSGGGLTWTNRCQVNVFPGAANGNSLSLWWAVAPTALTGATITATGNAVWDDASILVFGVSGCNTASPWDANASLAARQISFGTPSFNSISTTQANDFLIFAWGSNSSAAIGTLPAGFTTIGYRLNGGGGRFSAVAAAYSAVTAAQTNQTYAWGSTIGGDNCAIFDALTADSGGSTTAPRPSYETVASQRLTNTNSISLPTAGISTNDVIVVVSYCLQSPSGPAISGISGGGLTWALRRRSHGSAEGSLEIWYAQVSGTLGLSTITISYAATFAATTVAVLSVTGCASQPWDGAAALPAMLSNTGGGNWTPSVSVSTTQAHDLMVTATGTFTNTPNISSVPSGFLFLLQLGPGFFAVGTQARSTTETGTATTWGALINDGAGASAAGEYIVDALTADAPGAPGGGTQASAMVLA